MTRPQVVALSILAILALLIAPATAQDPGVVVTPWADHAALSERVSDLEARVAALESEPASEPEPEPEPTEEPEPEPSEPDDTEDDPVPCTAQEICLERVLTDGEHFPDGFTVPADETWTFPANDTATVTTSGNVVVLGTLRMRPNDDTVTHTLQFTDVDESAFVGGGTSVLDSDVGLWVMDEGVLEAVGTERQGWARQWHPTWADDDEVVRAPTDRGDFFGFTSHAKTDPVPQAHPDVPPAELVNLTRNVRIEGTPEGNTHVLIHNHEGPQTIRNVALRYVGVSGVLGRYGLHFHHGFDATRGSLVENVVVRDGGSQGFVPHLSHGITFRRTVAFDVRNAGYWWDAPDGGTECRLSEPQPHPEQCNESNDIVYDHAFAGRIGENNDGRSGVNGFALMAGTGNTVTDSVAVGVGGQSTSSGFHWPSRANHGPNVWTYEDNVAHNNVVNGIFVWQNDNNPHVVDRFVGYRNGWNGIEHGAYGNPYVYRDALLVGNGGNRNNPDRGVPLLHHANARWNDATGTPAAFPGLVIDADGVPNRAAIRSVLAKAASDDPITFTDCELNGTEYGLQVDERESSGSNQPKHLRFVRCLVDGRDMGPADVLVTRNENGTTVSGVDRDGNEWTVP